MISFRHDSTVQPKHLWAAIQSELNSKSLPDTVGYIMRTWTEEAGFPVITVSKDNANNIKLEQQRFLQKNSHSTLGKSNWWVPITYTTGRQHQFSRDLVFWVKETNGFKLNLEPNEWMIVNLQSSGKR